MQHPDARIEGSLSLISIILLLKRSRLTFAVIVAVCVLTAIATAFAMTPVYRARVVLMPNPEAGNSGRLSGLFGNLEGIASIAGIGLNRSDITVEAVATLRSRQFTERFLQQADLLPKLFAEDWDKEAGSWTAGIADPPTIWDGYKKFDEDVRRISQDKRTGLITIDIDWSDREDAVIWANQIATMLNEQMQAREIREASASIAYLQDVLAKTEEIAIRQAINRLVEHQLWRRTVAEVRPDFALRVIDPAVPPDVDDFMRPKRALYVLAGLIAGVILGFGAVFAEHVLDELRNLRERT